MNNSLLPRISGRFILAFACVATALAAGARAQTTAADPTAAVDQHEAVQLDNFVVSASRTPQDLKYTSSSVSVIGLDDLAESQIVDLHTALAAEPGVVIVSSGGAGAQSSVLMRGANSYQTLFVVDGVRMNDRAAAYQNFLGQADLGGIDHIEVLRGPQSTLYGSSAMGGVITIDTTRGCGDVSGSVSTLAGSFNTLGGAASVQGGTNVLGYSGFVERTVTDNDRPNNNSKIWSYATRVEVKLSATTLLGATFRGQEGDYQEPGVIGNKYPGAVEAKNYLGTAYGQVRVGPEFTSRLTAGWHQRDYVFVSTSLNGDYTSNARNTRDILDWQNTWAPTSEVEIVAGANFERSYYTIDGEQTSDTVKAGFISATYHPLDTLTLTGGVREDDFRSAGSAFTWRTGASWLPMKGTKFRATYGTGFSAPGSDDRFGVAAYGQLRNPDLVPEKSHGWDVGFDQEIIGEALTTSITYFHNRFTNLFQWEYTKDVKYQGKIVNIGRATTSGVEFALASKINDQLAARIAYTYLDATDDAAGVRLIRRPRHVVDSEVRFQPTKQWIFGAGLHIVADREDFNYSLYQQLHAEDYTTVRLFTSYALTKNLQVKARLENALNESYSEVIGYPALPRAVFCSVEWKF
jgi:vitamin B12 transporter